MIAKFFSEILTLKATFRSGWNLIGGAPETVAEHIAITAQIAYVLAVMEGLNPEKCAAMALFHDNAEARIGDLHKIASLYLKKGGAERKAARDQFDNLPSDARKKILALAKEESGQKTPEAILVKDADWLDMAFRAKILSERGNKEGAVWFKWVKKLLSTESARKIFAEVEAIDDFSVFWWKTEKKEIGKREKNKKA